MAVLRYNFTMDDHIPSSQVTIFSRGAIVNGAQAAINTVTVHEGHDFEIGDKFLYALTRTNILTTRIFTITGAAATTITFSGAPATFTDKNYLVPLGTETGGVLQDDGTYSKLEWDGSDVPCFKDPNGDDAFALSNVPCEPGGEVAFWTEAADVWGIARATQGKPLRVYIVASGTADIGDLQQQVTNIEGDITNIENNIITIEGDVTNLTTNITIINGQVQNNQAAAVTLLETAFGWWRADSIVASQLNGGVLTDNVLLNAWSDSSGNDNHLTALGRSANINDAPSRPIYRVAGTGTSGNPYLPLVQLNGTTAGGGGFGHAGYFSIDTGTLTMGVGAGYTIFLAARDYASFVQSSQWLGCDTELGDPRGTDRIYETGTSGGTTYTKWQIQEGASEKDFAPNFTHTYGNDTEIIALRVFPSTGVLEQWVDGVRLVTSGDTRATAFVLRYIGMINIAGSWTFSYGKGLYELAIFNYSLTDEQVAIINAYLLERIGSGAGVLLASAIPRNIGTWVNNTATSGTDTACSNGTAYVGSVFVPANVRLAGIQYLVGSIGGTDKVVASLHNASGALLVSSDVAGTTVGTAATLQQVPFITHTPVSGPAWYFVALTFNGANAKFRTIPAYCDAGSGVIGNGVTQTFGTPASFTAPTTFTADKVPIASVY